MENKRARIPELFYVSPDMRPKKLKAVIEHDNKYALARPPVPGKAVDYIYVPSMGFMKGTFVEKGQVVRIIDLEGKQVPDVIIWDANDMANVHNCGWSQLLNKKWNNWKPGDALFSKNCDKLVTITEDTSGGMHAFIGTFCNERANYVRYGVPGTINCRDNLVSAMADYGFTADDIDWCSCISFFMNMPYRSDGSMGIEIAPSKPGDYIDLMAERDIIVAYSNCPSIRSATNDYNPTAMMTVIFNPDKEYQAKVAVLPKLDVLPNR
ncbi:DUF1989 domain-containing protein [Chloroflexota bacterium]